MTFHREPAGRRDLVVASTLAILLAAVAAAVPIEAVRTVAAVPLALVLPGYAAAMASFGRRLPDLPVLTMLVSGLSLSLLALGALLLHVLPGRFGEASWLAYLVVLVIGLCAIAARRRGKPAAGTAPTAPRLPRPSRAGAFLLGAGALLLAATVVLAATSLPAKDAVGYTRLWMLPSEPGANPPHVRVGVLNDEQEPVVYRLVLRVGGRRSIRRMDLDPGQQRIWRVTAPFAEPEDATPVTARLFRSDDPFTIYRRVNGWVPGA